MNSHIDYTILKPTATQADVFKACQKVIDKRYLCICVNPIHVRSIRQEFSGITICSVISFPLGADTLETKIRLIRQVIQDGADEVDVVINLGNVRGNPPLCEQEIHNLSKLAHNNGLVIKFIVEASIWTKEELAWLIKICYKHKADYIKTSTGMYKDDQGLSNKAERLKGWIKFLDNERKIHGYKIKIKASGGIQTQAQAQELIQAGAERIGTSTEL